MKDSHRQYPFEWDLKDNRVFWVRDRQGIILQRGWHVQNYRMMNVRGDENTCLLLLAYYITQWKTFIRNYATELDTRRKTVSGSVEGIPDIPYHF